MFDNDRFIFVCWCVHVFWRLDQKLKAHGGHKKNIKPENMLFRSKVSEVRTAYSMLSYHCRDGLGS